MPENFILIDNKKYLWDGKTYDTRNDAVKTSETYKGDRFEVQILEGPSEKADASDAGAYFVYTRRLA